MNSHLPADPRHPMEAKDLTMDHAEIAARRVVDRYLLGKLDPDEAQRFERHYLACPACLAELETTEQLVDGLRDTAAADLARAAVGAGLVARLQHFVAARRRPAVATLMVAVFAVVLVGIVTVPSGLLYRRLAAADAELGQSRAELAAAKATQAALAVLPLNALRDGGGEAGTAGTGPTRQIRLGPTPGWVVLSIELDHPSHDSYRVALHDGAGTPIWRGEGLVPNLGGNLTLAVYSTSLAAGDHRIEVAGLDSSGAFVPVAQLPFRVVD